MDSIFTSRPHQFASGYHVKPARVNEDGVRVTVKYLSVADVKKRDTMYHTLGLSVKAFKALTQGRKAWGPRSAGSSALSQASGS